jgi:hypothetical protein
MSLISKENLSLVLRSINKLLSFKADKSEVVLRKEVEEIDAIELAAKMGLIFPISAEDGAVYIDEDGIVYSL